MGFWGKLFGGGGKAVGEAAKGTLEGISDAAVGIRSAITGDLPPETRAELQKQAKEIESNLRTMQMEVNKAEAEHASLFVAGWRPAIGWIGAAGLAFQFVVRPLLQWGLIVVGVGEDVPELPRLDLSELITILGGMLGLGIMRTREKGMGVTGKGRADG